MTAREAVVLGLDEVEMKATSIVEVILQPVLPQSRSRSSTFNGSPVSTGQPKWYRNTSSFHRRVSTTSVGMH